MQIEEAGGIEKEHKVKGGKETEKMVIGRIQGRYKVCRRGGRAALTRGERYTAEWRYMCCRTAEKMAQC